MFSTSTPLTIRNSAMRTAYRIGDGRRARMVSLHMIQSITVIVAMAIAAGVGPINATSQSKRFVPLGVVAEDGLPLPQHQRPAHQVRVLENQIDGLGLRQLPLIEVELFVARAALAEDRLGALLVDETAEQLARRTFIGKVVFHELESATFQVVDRLAAARSRRFEVDLEFFG